MTFRLQIVIPAGLHSEPLLQLALDSISMVLNRDDVIVFVVNDGIDESAISIPVGLAVRFLKPNTLLLSQCIDGRTDAWRHGVCLDTGLQGLADGYGMFMDCDVCLLDARGLELLVEKLDAGAVIVGAPYPEKMDRNYACWPCATFCAFRVQDVRKMSMCFRQGQKLQACSHEEIELFGLTEMVFDVGWQLCQLKRTGSAFLLTVEYASGKKRSDDILWGDYRFKDGQRVIAAHLGSSSADVVRNNEWVRSMRHIIQL